ncbi:cytochrome P450 71A3-like [Miscanthus floridulus]|uniref:cytochrome P450 71A3-like n=1 Tax=Miscanthus floridulus TaxID=154761 RepID=UPI00345B4379
MALEQQVAPIALLLTVLIATPLAYVLFVVVAGDKKKPASAAAPTSCHDGQRLPLLPSPRGIPLLGHLHLLGALPHRSLASLARTHYPVLLLCLGRVPTVVVPSVAAAEEAMRARDLAFVSWPRSAMAERLIYGHDITFAPDDEYWRGAELLTEYANAVVSRAAFDD